MKNERKQVILQTLAKLLETRSPSKVTTALLAKESGITEAALYRHFPSKRRIFLEIFGTKQLGCNAFVTGPGR